MARARLIDGDAVETLADGWRLAVTPSGDCGDPASAARRVGWVAAPVPGTAATALMRAGSFEADAPVPRLAHKDVWYQRTLTSEGRRILRFEGLATVCEAWIDAIPIFTHAAMFTPFEILVDLTPGAVLWLCFRALEPRLAARGPRARWRPRMIDHQGLRLVRTTLLGRMPSWSPVLDVVGPWRPVSLAPPGPLEGAKASLRPTWTRGGARLRATLTMAVAAPPTLMCAGATEVMRPDGDGRYAVDMAVPDAQAWWPHSHGEQPLYSVVVEVDGRRLDLGRTGFRSVALDRGADGRDFALSVNGERVFCRGACWVPPDPVGLGGARADYEPTLRLAAEAGMNMIRVSGVGVYETPAFFEMCDELGLMVWQDFMFANFDYPGANPTFAAGVRAEAEAFLIGIDGSPSLTILCGGSEVFQQAEMLGLAPERRPSPLFEAILPDIAKDLCPDIPYVVNSPEGRPLAFLSNAGASHYYGLGAYERPIEDVRRAEVKFTSECLAFANVPDARTLALTLPGVQPHDPQWKAGVPRDRGVSWDFEDVRDHYLREIFELDPYKLRREDPDTYLDLSRVVSGELMTAAFSEWRRGRSPCNGALVWFLRDQQPGAGWGVIDASGDPKAAWYALKRISAPVQVAVTDEGVNGLAVHMINERPGPLMGELRLSVFGDETSALIDVRRPLELAARASTEVSAFDLTGRFFDISYAYRFGRREHSAVRAQILENGAVVSEAFHFMRSAGWASDGRVAARLERDADEWRIHLRADRLLRFVHIADEAFRPRDDWFALAPGEDAIIGLARRADAPVEACPSGEIRLPGGRVVGHYGSAEGETQDRS
jgi:beta-mannosidase